VQIFSIDGGGAGPSGAQRAFGWRVVAGLAAALSLAVGLENLFADCLAWPDLMRACRAGMRGKVGHCRFQRGLAVGSALAFAGQRALGTGWCANADRFLAVSGAALMLCFVSVCAGVWWSSSGSSRGCALALLPSPNQPQALPRSRQCCRLALAGPYAHLPTEVQTPDLRGHPRGFWPLSAFPPETARPSSTPPFALGRRLGDLQRSRLGPTACRQRTNAAQRGARGSRYCCFLQALDLIGAVFQIRYDLDGGALPCQLLTGYAIYAVVPSPRRNPRHAAFEPSR